MGFDRVLLGLLLIVMVTVDSIPIPGGGGHRHVRHRIHVPQQIKTVYHTKIIKVPEHHHHFHEKEKIIIKKEEKKEHDHHEYPPLDDEEHDWEGSESSNIYKKKRYTGPSHRPRSKPKATKKRRIVLKSYSHHKKREAQ